MKYYSLDCFDDFTARLILCKARTLAKKMGFPKPDLQDLCQELAADLIERRQNFDPTRTRWEAFVVAICKNKAVSMLKHHWAQKRSPMREGASLNELVDHCDGEPALFSSTIPESQQGPRTGQCRDSHQKQFDVKHDVTYVVDKMPSEMRQACGILMHASKSVAVHEMGISWGQFYEIRDRIRSRFEKKELSNYLA